MARRSYNTGIKVWDMVLPKAYQDYEGNWYDAVILGDQVWLAENLHTKYYPDGTPITFGNNDTSDYSDQGRYYISESVVDNGYYYNISAVMNGASYTDAIPSGVQGIAMSGWHVPSKGEYEKLRIYLESNDEYVEIVGTTKKTAKSITSPYYWNETSTQGTPGYQSFNNNITGFNAVPSGNISVNSSGMHHYNLNQVVRFCTTSVVEMNPQNIFAAIASNSFYITTVNNHGTDGHSVRLVCDKKAKEFLKEYIDTYGGLSHVVFEYLKFIILENGVQVGIICNSASSARSLHCSTDNGVTWNAYTAGTTANYFGTFNTGDEIILRSTNFTNENTGMYRNRFVSTGGKWEARGNINSLKNWSSSIASNTFASLFNGCGDLVNAPYLPCTEMTGTYGYSGMFQSCTSLKKSPKLSFATPTANAYQGMFSNCTSLVYAGEISTVTHQYATCASMFAGCTSLKTSPYIYAGTLATTCFYQMFAACTSLKNILFTLPSVTVPISAYQRMFSSCTSLTSPPNLPATTVEAAGYMEMFMGCTALVTPPSLPATTLDGSAYRTMFKGCTSLTSAPALPAETMATYCYGEMFQNCTSLTTPPALPSTTLANSCYRDMFNGCTSLTSAPSLPATTLQGYCYTNMFTGCTSLTDAPYLPSITLANCAYQSMFQNCSSLNYINAAFTTAPGTSYTQNWVQGVAENGTFVKNSEATWADTYGDHYIPTGWGVTDELRIQPLTFEATTNNTIIKLRSTSSSFSRTIEYSPDGNTWHSVTSSQSGTTITTLSSGEKIYIRGNNSAYGEYIASPFSMNRAYFVFDTGSPCYVYGNVMSLIGDGFETNTSASPEMFYGLFDSPSNKLDIKTNSNGKPLLALPATQLRQQCYLTMFNNCSYLRTAPALPATTLDSYCYAAMFSKCISLTSSPYLPSETLVNGCYSQMFENCSSLNRVMVNATSISANQCTQTWLSGVSSAGDFYYRDGVTWSTGVDGIPSGWTSHVLA